MQYEEAMTYLANLTKFGFNFGLERVTELVRRLGNPHEKLRIIHVGGTNGKGSTLSMLASILKSAGFRVGTFTSPHLHSYTERFRIDDKKISEERIARILTVLRPHLEAMVSEGFEHPTEFEVSTALAFQYFREEKVDFLVLEVGLGGLIDSTNIVDPLVSVITNVAMDHMDYLGHTLGKIASIKAGIIKNNTPVVTASDNEEVLEVIKNTCMDRNAVLTVVGQDVQWEAMAKPVVCDNNFLGEQNFKVFGRLSVYDNLRIPLLGEHQLLNAATAVAAIEHLIEKGFPVSKESIRCGLMKTRWPARLELIRKGPALVLIDGAHNHHGALSLRAALDKYFPEEGFVLVLGMLADKERAKVVSELAPRARLVVVTKPNSDRAGEWGLVADAAKTFTREVRLVENITEAVRLALAEVKPCEIICITGSLYMVAEAREELLGASVDW